MSSIYIASVVALLSALLPLMGFQVENSEVLTNTITNIITLVAGSFALYRRVQMGDIHWTGIRRK